MSASIATTNHNLFVILLHCRKYSFCYKFPYLGHQHIISISDTDRKMTQQQEARERGRWKSNDGAESRYIKLYNHFVALN